MNMIFSQSFVLINFHVLLLCCTVSHTASARLNRRSRAKAKTWEYFTGTSMNNQQENQEWEHVSAESGALDSIVGTGYFRQVGERIIDPDTIDNGFGYSVSMSDDGMTVAMSGMCIDPNTKEQYYRVMVFSEDNIRDSWTQKGSNIDNNRTTTFLEDSRAHVSLSGDGTRLSVATVYIRDRMSATGSIPEASVDVFEFGINSDWNLLSTEYSGSAGAGATVHHGIMASLDQSGSKIAIGMPYFDKNGTLSGENQGAVLVCDVGDSETCQSIATGVTSNDHVGSSVMISGNLPSCVVFGSLGSDTQNGTNSGSVSIYCDEYSNSTWSQRGKTLIGEAEGDEFGISVAISSDSNYIAVGAWRNDRNAEHSKDDGGHVRVFKFNSNVNQYVQVGSDIDGERGRGLDNYYVGDFSGYSLALSDIRDDNLIRVAIGAPNNEGGDYYNGHVRIYECAPEGIDPVWSQVLYDIDGETTRESAGRSIAINKDGTRVIFGSPEFNNDNGGDYYTAGSAVVYELNEHSAAPSISPTHEHVPSNVPSQKPSSTLLPSSLPSLSEKIVSSPEQEMILDGVDELSVDAIAHWKNVTEEIISNEFATDASVTSVDILILTVNGMMYNEERRNLFEGDMINQTCTIVYEVLITKRVEEKDKTFNNSIQSSISNALRSEEYIIDLTSGTDSSVRSVFANVSVQIGELIDAFQIQTIFYDFDFSENSTWCITASSITHGSMHSMVAVRRCKSDEKLQVWALSSVYQLQLVAFPRNPTCMKTQSRSIFLDSCTNTGDTDTIDEMETFRIDMDNHGGQTIHQTKGGTNFNLGLEPQREFTRIRLYEENGWWNDSLDKWVIIRGKYSTTTEMWNPLD